jgi:hypothetical protein
MAVTTIRNSTHRNAKIPSRTAMTPKGIALRGRAMRGIRDPKKTTMLSTA